MSVDGGGDSHDYKAALTYEEARTEIDKKFSRFGKVRKLLVNVRDTMHEYLDVVRGTMHPEWLPPFIPHYREFLDNLQRIYPPEAIDYIMQKSDPEAVAAFDRLVDEFNADLEDMKRTHDLAKLMDYVKRVDEIGNLY